MVQPKKFQKSALEIGFFLKFLKYFGLVNLTSFRKVNVEFRKSREKDELDVFDEEVTEP